MKSEVAHTDVRSDTSAPFEELKRYVGFSDVHAATLARFFPLVEPRAVWLIDRFYDAIDQNPRSRAVLSGPEQVERLKGTLRQWIKEMLAGPHDVNYYERRLRIGEMHVRVKLPQEFMFTSMNLMRTDLHEIANAELPTEEAQRVNIATSKIMDLELAIMLSTFIPAHERAGLVSFRELLASHLPDNVFLLDDKMRVVAPSTSSMVHFLRTPHISNLPIAEVLNDEILDATDLERRVTRAVAEGATVVLPRVQIDLPRNRRWLRVRIIPIHHELAKVFLQIEDLTDTIESEARIQRQERLSHLGTMAASVAHEIRNPLAGISSTIQVISNTFTDDDRRREPLRKVRDQVTRLGDLVGDLLHFARPIQVDLKVVDLFPVAQQAALQAEAAGMPLARIKGEGRALADQILLAQPLLNLIQNAWQAGAEDVLVEIQDGCITVCDDGPGIPESEFDRVFDAFFTTKTRGTGLGLPVARKVVEAMGGTIELGTCELRGAGFIIRLLAGDTMAANSSSSSK